MASYLVTIGLNLVFIVMGVLFLSTSVKNLRETDPSWTNWVKKTNFFLIGLGTIRFLESVFLFLSDIGFDFFQDANWTLNRIRVWGFIAIILLYIFVHGIFRESIIIKFKFLAGFTWLTAILLQVYNIMMQFDVWGGWDILFSLIEIGSLVVPILLLIPIFNHYFKVHNFSKQFRNSFVGGLILIYGSFLNPIEPFLYEMPPWVEMQFAGYYYIFSAFQIIGIIGIILWMLGFAQLEKDPPLDWSESGKLTFRGAVLEQAKTNNLIQINELAQNYQLNPRKGMKIVDKLIRNGIIIGRLDYGSWELHVGKEALVHTLYQSPVASNGPPFSSLTVQNEPPISPQMENLGSATFMGFPALPAISSSPSKPLMQIENLSDAELVAEVQKFQRTEANLTAKQDSIKKALFYKLMAEYEEKLEILHLEMTRRGLS